MAAVEMLAHRCCWSKLLQVASALALDSEPGLAAVRRAADAFRAAGQTETARELLSRLGDHKVGRAFLPQQQIYKVCLLLRMQGLLFSKAVRYRCAPFLDVYLLHGVAEQ